MNIKSIITLAAVAAFPLTHLTAEDGTTDKKEKKAGAYFKKLDTDGDGSVSKTEFLAAAKNPEKAEKRFASLDTDGSGSLSKEELAAGAKNKKPKTTDD